MASHRKCFWMYHAGKHIPSHCHHRWNTSFLCCFYLWMWPCSVGRGICHRISLCSNRCQHQRQNHTQSPAEWKRISWHHWLYYWSWLKMGEPGLWPLPQIFCNYSCYHSGHAPFYNVHTSTGYTIRYYTIMCIHVYIITEDIEALKASMVFRITMAYEKTTVTPNQVQ